MNAFLPKLAVLGVVAGGFYATGDLPRLIDRGRRIAERSSTPLPAAESETSVLSPPAYQPAPPELPPAPAPRFEAPMPSIAQARPAPQTPTASEPAVAPPTDRAAEEPTRIPMPPLTLEAVDLASLQPGQRVLLLCGRHVIALDVVDGPAGEVLEHAHACHADRTVTIASTAAPRRLVVIGCASGSSRSLPRGDRRMARGEWVHVVPSGSVIPSGSIASGITSGGIQPGRATAAGEAIGPIEAIGLE